MARAIRQNRTQTSRSGYDETVYRGYRIRPYSSGEGYWVEKDGFPIQRYVATVDAAKQIIDTIADEMASAREGAIMDEHIRALTEERDHWKELWEQAFEANSKHQQDNARLWAALSKFADLVLMPDIHPLILEAQRDARAAIRHAKGETR